MKHSILLPLLFLICSTTWAADAPPLPIDVQNAVIECDKKVNKAKAELIVKLQKVQDAATKRGDLDLAVLMKKMIAENAPGAEENTGDTPQDLKKRLAGKFNFTLPNGHSGPLEVKGNAATDVPSGIQGDVKIVGEVLTIFWSNNTQWYVIAKDGVLTLKTPNEGCAPLTLVEVKKH